MKEMSDASGREKTVGSSSVSVRERLPRQFCQQYGRLAAGRIHVRTHYPRVIRV